MKNLLISLLIPLVGCTAAATNNTQTSPSTEADAAPVEEVDAGPTEVRSDSELPADRCLDGQDMDGADVDISMCPPLPTAPGSAKVGTLKVDLGAWEMGTTAKGETYKYGSLSAPTTDPRVLTYDTGSEPVNAQNVECWAKGYYRLRKIVQDPPIEYVTLRKAGFQYRFFQFQSDLRNGATGFKKITSFQDHLVKWVTVIQKDGTCDQPTLSKFRDYAAAELKTRKLTVPSGT